MQVLVLDGTGSIGAPVVRALVDGAIMSSPWRGPTARQQKPRASAPIRAAEISPRRNDGYQRFRLWMRSSIWHATSVANAAQRKHSRK